MTPDERQRLCEALMKLCQQYGSDEVAEALRDVFDAIAQDTGELGPDELAEE